MNSKTKKALNISLTVIFIISLTLFILTFSIGLPIYCRFFYYIQIKTLKMEETTGWSYSTIKAAYDDVLNYLTLPNRPFGTGELKWTAEEAAHFADCKALFNLNLAGMIVSGAITLTLVLLNKFKVITLVRPMGHRAYLLSAIIALALPLIIGALAAIDFDKAFLIFHKIFFPGKDNWTFDYATEQIINVMPQEFFMNCAIIIGAGLIGFSAALITADLVLWRKEKNTDEKNENAG